ncbi:hypothetical protein FF38_08834, partial [Lucilia cuprina]
SFPLDFPLQRHFEDYNTGYITTPTHHTDYRNADNDEDDDEEDYSVSVSAIMQRRASVRGYRRKSSSRNSRRASSPMDHVLDNVERRRSSVYTTSSEVVPDTRKFTQHTTPIKTTLICGQSASGPYNTLQGKCILQPQRSYSP